MSPEELALLATSLGIAIAKDKTNDEINIIAIVLSQISTTLGTISIQRDNLKPKKDDTKEKEENEEEEAVIAR